MSISDYLQWMRLEQTLLSNLAKPITEHHNLHQHVPTLSLLISHSSSSPSVFPSIPLMSVCQSADLSACLPPQANGEGNSPLSGEARAGRNKTDDRWQRQQKTGRGREGRKGSGGEVGEERRRMEIVMMVMIRMWVIRDLRMKGIETWWGVGEGKRGRRRCEVAEHQRTSTTGADTKLAWSP